MTTTTQPTWASGTITALIAGDTISWSEVSAPAADLLEFCRHENLVGLVSRRLRHAAPDCPPQILDAFATAARAEAALEMLRQREIAAVLDELGRIGIHPVLFKGTALAYLHYPSPDLRPRNDTDLLIRRGQVDEVRALLEQRHYREPAYCDGELIFCQFELQKTDGFGLLHALDFHWKVSTQTLFADLLTYEEMFADSVDIPALGANARGAGVVHALLLACVHPVMHHHGANRIIWLYDIHLLASQLTSPQWLRFTEGATSRGMAAICAHELQASHKMFGTVVPGDVIRRFTAVGRSEPAAAYLASDRRWSDELVSNVRGLKSWRDRARLLREVMFPGASYMLKSYELSDGLLTRALLPALYAHRGMAGMLKVLRGTK